MDLKGFSVPVRIHILAFSLAGAVEPNLSKETYWYVRERFFGNRHHYTNSSEFFSKEHIAQCNKYERDVVSLSRGSRDEDSFYRFEMKGFVDHLQKKLGDFVVDYLPPWIQLEVVTET